MKSTDENVECGSLLPLSFPSSFAEVAGARTTHDCCVFGGNRGLACRNYPRLNAHCAFNRGYQKCPNSGGQQVDL